MAVALRDNHGHSPRTKTESARLKELKDEAAEIRRRHESGEINGKQAAFELSQLKSRYRGLFDLLFS